MLFIYSKKKTKKQYYIAGEIQDSFNVEYKLKYDLLLPIETFINFLQFALEDYKSKNNNGFDINLDILINKINTFYNIVKDDKNYNIFEKNKDKQGKPINNTMALLCELLYTFFNKTLIKTRDDSDNITTKDIKNKFIESYPKYKELFMDKQYKNLFNININTWIENNNIKTELKKVRTYYIKYLYNIKFKL